MLIQNASNIAQALQPDRTVNDRLASNGGSSVVANTPVETTHITTTQVTPQQPSSEQLKNAVEAINQAMRQSNSDLEFSVDPNTKKLIVRIVDTGTGVLIRQIPSEEVLAIARSIDQFLLRHQFQHGLLLTQNV